MVEKEDAAKWRDFFDAYIPKTPIATVGFTSYMQILVARPPKWLVCELTLHAPEKNSDATTVVGGKRKAGLTQVSRSSKEASYHCRRTSCPRKEKEKSL